MNQKKTRRVVSSCLGDEERVVGCVGALFQILDWNTSHSSSSSSTTTAIATIASGGKGVSKQQAHLPGLHLLHSLTSLPTFSMALWLQCYFETHSEAFPWPNWNTFHSTSSSSSTTTIASGGKGVSKQQAPLPETREAMAMQRAPGVVARLMGLQSLPSPEEDCRLLLHHVDQVAALLSARTAVDCHLAQSTAVMPVPPCLGQPDVVVEAAAHLTPTPPAEGKTRRPSRRGHHCHITDLTTAMSALPCLGQPGAVTEAAAPLTPTPLPTEEKTRRPNQRIDDRHIPDLTTATSATAELGRPRVVRGTEMATPLTLLAEEKTRRQSQISHHCHIADLTTAMSAAPGIGQLIGVMGTEQAAPLTLLAEEKTGRKNQRSHRCNVTHPSTATSAAPDLGQLVGVTPSTLPAEEKTRRRSQGSHHCHIAEVTAAMSLPPYLGHSIGAMEIEGATHLTMEDEPKRRRPSVYIKRGSTQESESPNTSDEMHDRRDKHLPLDSGQLLSSPLHSRSRPSFYTSSSSSNYSSKISLAPSHNMPAGLSHSGKLINSPNNRKNRLKTSDERRKPDSIPKKEESFMKLLVKRRAARRRMIEHAEDQNRFSIIDSEIENKRQDLRPNLKTVLRHSDEPSSKPCTSRKVKRLSSTSAKEIELADSEVSDSVYAEDFGQPSPVSILESPFQDESSQSSESLDSFPDSKYEVEYDNHRACSSHGEASLANRSLEPILRMSQHGCFDSSSLLGLVPDTKSTQVVKSEQDYIKEVMKYMGTLLQEPSLMNHHAPNSVFTELERQHCDKWEWDTCLDLGPSCRKQLARQYRKLVFDCVKEALTLKLGGSSNPTEGQYTYLFLYSLEGEIERQVEHWRKASKVATGVLTTVDDDDMVVMKWNEGYYCTNDAIITIEECLYEALIEELLDDVAMHT